jgi:hypothetical protein
MKARKKYRVGGKIGSSKIRPQIEQSKRDMG